MKKSVLVILALMLFGLYACTGGGTSDSKIADRLAALEAEVKALKLEAGVREKDFREELALIRKNLEGIQELLKVEKGRADALGSPKAKEKAESPDSDLDAKAKSFVDENLDRLLDITRKLLDKMEQQLDEQMKKEETPKAPEGDEI